MGEIDRRTFLRLAGKWLLVAGMPPVLAGCAKTLDTTTSASETGTTGVGDTGTSVSVGSSTESTGPSALAESTTGSSTPSSAGASTTLSPAGYPDLAVTKGESVDKNARAALAMLGGMARFVKKDAKVVIKPNVLNGLAPEYAVCTSPELMSSVIHMCWEAGAKEVVVFDHTTADDRSAFETSGLTKAVADADAKLLFLSNRNYEEMDIPEGRVLTSGTLAAEAFEADTLIDLALPKTHNVGTVTLTMKNLMGVMGSDRGRMHYQFAPKIVDLHTLVKPHLAILDGYRVLFRNGPSGGSLKDVRLAKTLVAGTNLVSIDAYGTSFFDNLKPADVDWLVEAAGRGMGEIDLSKLKIQTADA